MCWCAVTCAVTCAGVTCAVQEEDELIAEWHPEPLVPAGTPNNRVVNTAPVVTG